MLGAMLLEAGELRDAIAHLEAAVSIDPANMPLTELARAYAYEGRIDEALAVLARSSDRTFTHLLVGRLELWRGRRYEFHLPSERLQAWQVSTAAISERCYATGTISDADLAELWPILARSPARWRASQAQHLAEVLAASGKHDVAIETIRMSVDAGVSDALWFKLCPVLEPLRSRPDFAELAAIVQARADTIVTAIYDALR